MSQQSRILASAEALAGPARFSTAEFVRMVEAGAFDDIKVELVEGELQRMNPPMGGHASRQADVVGALWAALRTTPMRVVGEIGIDLGSDTILGCDAAVLHAPMHERRFLRPDEIALVIEIAETTLTRDLGLKRAKYAAAGIAEYWVVDGARAVTHVYREPIDGDYASVATTRFGESLAVPGAAAAIVLA